jgi:hypothetical protein
MQPPVPAPCTPISPTPVDEQLVFTCKAAAPRLFSPVYFRHGPHGQNKREQRRPPLITACKTGPTHFSLSCEVKRTSCTLPIRNSRSGRNNSDHSLSVRIQELAHTPQQNIRFSLEKIPIRPPLSIRWLSLEILHLLFSFCLLSYPKILK